MNSTPRISVLIVNYNAGDYLERCVASLSGQTLAPARIIVVDNASTDGSLSRIANKFPDVEVVGLAENIGFAAANNLAVKKVDDCEWIAFLNPDAFPEPDWLQNLLQTATANPEYSFFGSHMKKYGSVDELDGTGDIYHVSGLAWRRDHGMRPQDPPRSGGEIFAPCAAAAFFRRSVFVDAGGFDEHFFCYFEDVDLAFRLRLKGERCLYVPDAVVEHVGSATTHRNSDFAVYHGHRNLIWSYFKNMPTPLFWIFLPQHLLANLAALLLFSLRGQVGVIFKAKWDAFNGLSRVLEKRKEIQAGTTVSARDLKRVMARGILLPYMKWMRS